eukprot:TRINITY_DN55714_c0_g1_i1.p1 TRINITY_DN55714_c0_g1~~TRINITY_DN55714_c0_g1_i1.p1  ORF type:complete len:458 (-),score=69.79 TRINITY_DN55714_c0_g1_i1:125-1498(-)
MRAVYIQMPPLSTGRSTSRIHMKQDLNKLPSPPASPRGRPPSTPRSPSKGGRKRTVLCPAACTCRLHAASTSDRLVSKSLSSEMGSSLFDSQELSDDVSSMQDDVQRQLSKSSQTGRRDPSDKLGPLLSDGVLDQSEGPSPRVHASIPAISLSKLPARVPSRSDACSSRQSSLEQPASPGVGLKFKHRTSVRQCAFFLPRASKRQSRASIQEEVHLEQGYTSREGGYESRMSTGHTGMSSVFGSLGDSLRKSPALTSQHHAHHPSTCFDAVMNLSKRHVISLQDVKEAAEEFRELDADGSGELSLGEFEAAIRKYCHLREDEEVPEDMKVAIMLQADKNGDGSIAFEEYLLWMRQCGFFELVSVTDPTEREFRALAREVGMEVPEIEKLRDVFSSFDTDGSGFIERVEFVSVMMHVMKIKHTEDFSDQRLRRYWNEAAKGAAHLSFANFVRWYIEHN